MNTSGCKVGRKEPQWTFAKVRRNPEKDTVQILVDTISNAKSFRLTCTHAGSYTTTVHFVYIRWTSTCQVLLLATGLLPSHHPGKLAKPHFMVQISGVSSILFPLQKRETVDSFEKIWKECFYNVQTAKFYQIYHIKPATTSTSTIHDDSGIT